MADKPAYNPQPVQLYEFKGLNADLWIEKAMERCLSSPFESVQNYIIAVDMLESIVCAKARDNKDYEAKVALRVKEIEKVAKWEDGRVGTDGQAQLASFRFNLLLKKIMDKMPEDMEGIIQ